MIPRMDASYRKLPSALKALYLTGMPAIYLREPARAFTFRNEKTSRAQVLSAAAQRAAYEEFKKVRPEEQQFTLFTSNPTDHEALLCATQLIRHHYAESKFFDCEFVSPTESLPISNEDGRYRALYILVGVNFKDESILAHVRRWVRAPLGSAIWVVASGEAPVEWASYRLCVKPSFLFSLKEEGISTG